MIHPYGSSNTNKENFKQGRGYLSSHKLELEAGEVKEYVNILHWEMLMMSSISL